MKVGEDGELLPAAAEEFERPAVVGRLRAVTEHLVDVSLLVLSHRGQKLLIAQGAEEAHVVLAVRAVQEELALGQVLSAALVAANCTVIVFGSADELSERAAAISTLALLDVEAFDVLVAFRRGLLLLAHFEFFFQSFDAVVSTILLGQGRLLEAAVRAGRLEERALHDVVVLDVFARDANAAAIRARLESLLACHQMTERLLVDANVVTGRVTAFKLELLKVLPRVSVQVSDLDGLLSAAALLGAAAASLAPRHDALLAVHRATVGALFGLDSDHGANRADKVLGFLFVDGAVGHVGDVQVALGVEVPFVWGQLVAKAARVELLELLAASLQSRNGLRFFLDDLLDRRRSAVVEQGRWLLNLALFFLGSFLDLLDLLLVIGGGALRAGSSSLGGLLSLLLSELVECSLFHVGVYS